MNDHDVMAEVRNDSSSVHLHPWSTTAQVLAALGQRLHLQESLLSVQDASKHAACCRVHGFILQRSKCTASCNETTNIEIVKERT